MTTVLQSWESNEERFTMLLETGVGAEVWNSRGELIVASNARHADTAPEDVAWEGWQKDLLLAEAVIDGGNGPCPHGLEPHLCMECGSSWRLK